MAEKVETSILRDSDENYNTGCHSVSPRWKGQQLTARHSTLSPAWYSTLRIKARVSEPTRPVNLTGCSSKVLSKQKGQRGSDTNQALSL